MNIRLIKSALFVFLALTCQVYSQSALNVKDSLGNSLLYIRSDGNIGIGSMNPLVRLQVMGDVRSTVLSGHGARLLFADDRGTIFARGTLPRPGWSLTGNKGTGPDTNFLGTLDDKALIFKTGGGGPLNERMRIQPEGSISVNSTEFHSGDIFASYGAGYPGAINNDEAGLYPVSGYSAGDFSGIYGENTAGGDGVLGVNTGSGAGLFGQNTSTGSGVKGMSLKGFGIVGLTGSSNASGILAMNRDSLGTGLISIGSGITHGLILEGGVGLSSLGSQTGLFAQAEDSLSGTGIVSAGNSISSPISPKAGSGISGTGRQFGVTGFARSDTSAKEKWGGYFEAAPSSYAFSGGRLGKTDYGVLTSGTNAIMVKDGSGVNRVMFNPASPEAVLEDYGAGQLERGFAHVSLDTLFSRAIVIDEMNPIKVFVQVEGDCNGVYVTNKTKEGFDVRELKGGRSHVQFSWHAAATRGNSVNADGSVESDYSSLRFPVGAGRPEVRVYNTTKVDAGNSTIPEKNKKHQIETKKPGGKKKRK